MELHTTYVRVRNGAVCQLLSAAVLQYWMFRNRKGENISDLLYTANSERRRTPLLREIFSEFPSSKIKKK